MKMPKHSNVFVGFTATLICAHSVAQDPEGTLVVANRAGGSISFIDLPSGIEYARHPIGPRVPHELAISPNGRIVISSNYGTGDSPGTKVLVFDVPSASLIGEIDLGPETRPHSFDFLPDGRRAVATMERAGAIALVDVLDRRVIDTFAAGGSDNHMVRVSPDGNTAYVAGRGGGRDFVNHRFDRQSANWSCLKPAQGPKGWPLVRMAAKCGLPIVSQIRSQLLTLGGAGFLQRLQIRGRWGRVEISDSGRVLIPTAGNPRAAVPQVLSIYDQDSNELVEQHTVREASEGPGGFSIHVAGELAYTADRGSNSLLVYDLDNFPESRLLAAEPGGFLTGSPTHRCA